MVLVDVYKSIGAANVAKDDFVVIGSKFHEK